MTRRRDIVGALKAAGFTGKGGAKHERWARRDGRAARVGRHEEIPLPTARLIAKQAKIKPPG